MKLGGNFGLVCDALKLNLTGTSEGSLMCMVFVPEELELETLDFCPRGVPLL